MLHLGKLPATSVFFVSSQGTRMSSGHEVVRSVDRNNTAVLGRGCCLLVFFSPSHLDVEPNIGGKTPKWMVKVMENPIKMDDYWMIWGYHYFWKHPFGKNVLSEIGSFL